MKQVPAIAGAALATGLILSSAAQLALAHDDHRIRVKLDGYDEVPALSSPASGRFRIDVDRRGQQIKYELSYEGIPSAVTQAHIHFGQRGVNGGIVAFLCSNLGNGPAGTQACPTQAGTISGMLSAADVIGPSGQGIAAGEFAEFLGAIDEGVTYVNVHSTQYPAGEIRAQLR
jgi:hypothetical protein